MYNKYNIRERNKDWKVVAKLRNGISYIIKNQLISETGNLMENYTRITRVTGTKIR